MNLRRCLYIACPQAGYTAFVRIARWTRVLPSLWQVLLADALPAAMDERCSRERILFNVDSDMQRALQRLDSLLNFLRAHPRLDEVAGLERYLSATGRHLAELYAANLPSPSLCACLEDSNSQDAVAPVRPAAASRLEQLQQSWHALEQAMQDRNFAAVEALLGFTELGLRLTDWKAWSGVFGFAMFEHHYFHDAFRQPLAMDYEDYDYDDFGSEPEIGGGRVRFKSNGRWGVCAADERMVLQPEWDRVLRLDEHERDLVWVKRRRRYGLASLAGEPAGRLLVPPLLEQVSGFRDGLAVVGTHSGMGMLDRSGAWRVEPVWDELNAFAQRRAVVRRGGKFGFIDEHGAVVVAPRFEEADDFNASGLARVRAGELCGLIRADGGIAAPIQYSRLEWADTFPGWLATRAGTTALLHADGSAWTQAAWDTIEVAAHGESMRVQRGNRIGLLDWSGARELVPCEFSVVEPLEPHVLAGQEIARPELMRVALVPGETAPRVGVWHLRDQRYLIPCQYDFIWLASFGRAGSGFVVANRNAKRGESIKGGYSVGLLRADGSVLVEQSYAWIAEPTALNRPDARKEIRDTLHFEWSQGRPVAAAARKNGPIVWLTAPLK